METKPVLTRMLAACDRISHSWNLEEGLSAVVHAVFSLLKPRSVAIALADERAGQYRIVAWRGLSAGFVNHHRLSVDSPLVRRLIVGRESVELPQYGADDDDAAGLRLETPSGSLLAVPIEAMNRPVGLIVATSDEPNRFASDDLLLLQIAARMAGACHDRCSLYLERQRLACVEPQSGLWSFEFFCRRMNEEIARSRRADKPLSLLLVDIDALVAFHEVHGEDAADELILRFVDRVRSTLRGIDFAGRFGLNEMLVALPETSLKGAQVAAQRILTALRDHPLGPGGQLITASIGAAHLGQDPECAMGAMLERAQKALYQAQFHGGNRAEAAES